MHFTDNAKVLLSLLFVDLGVDEIGSRVWYKHGLNILECLAVDSGTSTKMLGLGWCVPCASTEYLEQPNAQHVRAKPRVVRSVLLRWTLLAPGEQIMWIGSGSRIQNPCRKMFVVVISNSVSVVSFHSMFVFGKNCKKMSTKCGVCDVHDLHSTDQWIWCCRIHI